MQKEQDSFPIYMLGQTKQRTQHRKPKRLPVQIPEKT